LDRRTSLDTETKRKISFPCQESNPSHPVYSQLLYRLGYPIPSPDIPVSGSSSPPFIITWLLKHFITTLFFSALCLLPAGESPLVYFVQSHFHLPLTTHPSRTFQNCSVCLLPKMKMCVLQFILVCTRANTEYPLVRCSLSV
jgi:hypothetical protein